MSRTGPASVSSASPNELVGSYTRPEHGSKRHRGEATEHDNKRRSADIADTGTSTCPGDGLSSVVPFSETTLFQNVRSRLRTGQQLRLQGDRDGALDVLESCCRLIRTKGVENKREALKLEGMALAMSSIIYEEKGIFDTAFERGEEALRLSRQTQNRADEERYLGIVGQALSGLGQYDKALVVFSLATDISRNLGLLKKEAINLGDMGNVHHSLGQYEEAIQCHKNALSLSRKPPIDRDGEATHLGNLGSVYQSIGQNRLAVEYQTMAFRLSRQIGNYRGLVSDLCNLGTAYRSLGQTQKSLECQRAALTIARETDQDAKVQALVLANMANSLRSQKRVPEAIVCLEEALVMSEASGSRSDTASILSDIGIAHLGCDDASSALPILERASMAFATIQSEIQTDRERVTYADTSGPVATRQALQQALVRLHRYEHSLEAAEHSRSYGLEMRLRQEHTLPPRKLAVADMREFAIRQRVAVVYYSQVGARELFVWVIGSCGGPLHFERLLLQQNGPSVSQLVSATRHSLGASDWFAYDMLSPASGLRWTKCGVARPAKGTELSEANLLDAMKRKEVDGVVEFSHDDWQTFGIVDLNVEHYVHIGDFYFRPAASPATASDDEVNEKRMLRRCHKLLVDPLSSVLEKEESLMIVPDRDLFALPFAALVDSEGRYIIERKRLRVAPSFGAVIESERRTQHTASLSHEKRAFVVGDVGLNESVSKAAKHTASPPRALPGACSEAEEVAHMLTQTGCQARLCARSTSRDGVARVRVCVLSCFVWSRSDVFIHPFPWSVQVDLLLKQQDACTTNVVNTMNRSHIIHLAMHEKQASHITEAYEKKHSLCAFRPCKHA